MTTPANAQREATIAETKAYNEAPSLAAYHESCRTFLEGLKENMVENSDMIAATDDHADDDDDDDDGDCDHVDIGPYEKARYYANGLFSTIYKAKAPTEQLHGTTEPRLSGVLVALKVTVPSVMGPPHDSQREARLLKVAQNVNIIPLWDSFRNAGSQFVLVFPFMPYSLDELVCKQNLTRGRTVTILRDIFSALGHIHSLGIIHRDVKPSNILLKSLDGPALLSDFGIAWSAQDPASESSDNKITDVGTTSYRAPELLFGDRSYNHAIDLWAAGCVVYELVASSTRPLFESGELGSELTLIHSMFKVIGTPTLDVWPEAAKFPDWGKMQFFEYPPTPWAKLLPKASETEQDLVSQLVRYESGQRLQASEALQHPYFRMGL